MGSYFKYVMFDIPTDDHMKLKLHGIENGRTLKSMLQEAVTRYVATLPEQVSSMHTEKTDEPAEDQGQGMGPMSL